MYRHCTFCASELGTNQVIETFPVGRRLAFDPDRGRLWVVCRTCERWNLTPVEERWEAIEESARTFHETALRASTDQIGLARHREGLELVRIGSPQRPEFAAWRYGNQFGRRRRSFIRRAVVGTGLVGGLALGSAGVLGGMLALQLGANVFNLAQIVRRRFTPGIRFLDEDGEVVELGPDELMGTKLRPGSRGTGNGADWHLRLPSGGDTRIVSGPAAVRALRAILPRVNTSGGSKSTVLDAVGELDEAGGAEAYFGVVEQRARRIGHGYKALPGLPPPIRLALEMATHEDSERRALDGELAWLEAAWRDAEEIAAIADDLTLGDRVRGRFEELRARHARTSEDDEFASDDVAP